jgi:OmpA-OmpF porin, OOP family
MKKMFLIFISLFVSFQIIQAQNQDAEGCKDYPMFNRMPNFHIAECEIKEFDAYKFIVENSTAEDAKKQTVEGKYYHFHYGLNEEATAPSQLQIFRNFENALKQIKATIVGKVTEVGNCDGFICAKVVKGKSEIWFKVESGCTGVDYNMYIIEKELMVQAIQANDMIAALNTDGYIALDILFDTGKATIKQESQEIIEQIYIMLNTNTSLKVSVEGHTDNVGDAASNKKLSEARAKAVMDALIAKGIKKERLASVGWGQEKPVSDNRTEDGRAKNRRVEIVKK